MKKLLSLILIACTLLSVCACSHTSVDEYLDPYETHEFTEKEKEEPKEPKIYDTSVVIRSSIFALEQDGIIYHFGFCPCDVRPNRLYDNAPVTLCTTLLDEPNSWTYLCPDPTCRHRDYQCELYVHMQKEEVGNDSHILVVKEEGRTMPMVYAFGSAQNQTIFLRKYDPETGKSSKRTFKRQILAEAVYCAGKIYMEVSDRGFIDAVAMYDLDTLAYEELYLDGDDAGLLGVWNDRVWFITSKFKIGSCALDFTDVREEYDCGVSPLSRYATHLRGCVDDGVLYLERDRQDAFFQGMYYGDIYAIDLNDIGAGETLVAEKVTAFIPHNGDLYYTVWDYSESEPVDEFRTPVSTDGGNIYVFDADEKTSTTVIENSNISVFNFYQVTDDVILFRGVDAKEPRGDKDGVTPRYTYPICVYRLADKTWDKMYWVPYSFDANENLRYYGDDEYFPEEMLPLFKKQG